MSITAVRARFDPVRSLGFASINGTLAGVGTELAHPARCVYILNNTDKILSFSFDGINDHIILPALGYWFWDIASNQSLNRGWYLAEGERLYVKALAAGNPTLGSVYFTAMYGQEH
jgi:hypothetical protein